MNIPSNIDISIPCIVFDVSYILNNITAESPENKIDFFLNSDFSQDEIVNNSVLEINESAKSLFNIKSKSEFIDNINEIFLGNFNKILYSIIFIKKNIFVNLKQFKADKFFRGKVIIDRKKSFYSEKAFVYIVDFDSESVDYGKENSKNLYEFILNNIEQCIIIIDHESEIIIDINTKISTILNKSKNDIIGSFHWSHVHPQDTYRYINKINESAGRDELFHLFESYFLASGGVRVPFNIDIKTSLFNNKIITVIILHELTNKIKSEERRKLLATAVEQSAESVIITDVFGNIQYVNPAFEITSGYQFTDVVGKNPKILKSGKISDDTYKILWAEVSSGNVWRGVLVNKKKGGELYTEEVTITPVKDNFGIITNYVGVKRDITNKIILENQVRQTQKMQAIGTLAGGVAHDFNNILTAIIGYAELTQEKCEQGTILYNNITEIIKASDRAASLVDQILKFSRQGEKSISNLNFNVIVKETVKLLRASISANIELIVEINNNVNVKADPTQMHQVLMNLCTNSFQSIENNGYIKIILSKKYLTLIEGVNIGNLPAGYYACLQVIDNGCGVPKEHIPRIFEPYFTTKKNAGGTGLGLSVVHGIINDHGGAITVLSIPGNHTCFSVYLPEAENVDEDSQEIKNYDYTSSNRKILIIDDEQPILHYLSKILEENGYVIQQSFSSNQSFNIFLEDPEYFDLIITDMGMPGLTGLDLSKKIKKIRPSIPIILCTGYSSEVTSDNYIDKGLNGFLTKPFNKQTLLNEINRVLAGQNSG